MFLHRHTHTHIHRLIQREPGVCCECSGCSVEECLACNAWVNACKDERITDVSITAPVPAVLIFPPSLPAGAAVGPMWGPLGARAEWCVCRLSVMNGEPCKIFLITYEKRVQRAHIHTCKWRTLARECITVRLTAFLEPKVWEELFSLERERETSLNSTGKSSSKPAQNDSPCWESAAK